MDKLPQHKISMHSDFGIHLRKVNSSQSKHIPMTYAHQDDYYMFGLVENGKGCSIIDFKEQHFAPGDIVLIQPGQVHHCISLENAEYWVLFIDSCFVDYAEKCIFDNFSLFASSFQMDEQRRNELKQIASLLAGRMDNITDKQTKTTAIHMAKTLVSIVAEAVQDINQQQTKHSRRHMEIVLSFRHLLAEHLATSRLPSYYASLLNISTVYLNEVVKDVTGMSATLYIKNELVLQAKRLLVHTDLAVKEISNRLGLDDYAYFSRLFAQTTGINPTLFRERNLE
ncbi:MAG: AraC family transcriptional regulator [Prevotellaceae bacterium]|nr:AraC family transcriptional regulator [Prevotellaceae bacterium]